MTHAEIAHPALTRESRPWHGRVSAWAAGRRGRWRQVLFWTIVALVLLRLLTPLILTRIANVALADGEQVRGSISGLSLSLWRCDYTVHGLELRQKRDDERWRPLLTVDDLHCDLSWGRLLRGELVGQVTAQRPVLHVFAEAPPSVEELPVPLAQPAPHEPAAPPWQDAVRTVVRVHLTQVRINDGRISYHDERRGIETGLDHITGQVDDLVIPEPALTHRCPFRFSAGTPGGGRLHLDGEADVLAKAPTFLLRAQVEDIDLPRLNPLTEKANNLTFADGTFQGFAEIVADGRLIGGYLKVLFHRLDIRSFGESDPATGTVTFWGVLIELAEDILENEELHQHAARIPLRGRLADPATDVWTAIGTALRNAFIGGLTPGFERGGS